MYDTTTILKNMKQYTVYITPSTLFVTNDQFLPELEPIKRRQESGQKGKILFLNPNEI